MHTLDFFLPKYMTSYPGTGYNVCTGTVYLHMHTRILNIYLLGNINPKKLWSHYTSIQCTIDTRSSSYTFEGIKYLCI